MESQLLADQIADEVFLRCASYEAQFSRFIPTSELSLVNTQKHAVVSDEFFTVLEQCYKAYVTTNHAYNPLVQVGRLGYDRDFSQLLTVHEMPVPTNYNIDFSSTVRDPHSNTVILQADQQLDFGGFLKGYLAEKIATTIAQNYPQCQGAIVNLGGDLHTIGVDEVGEPFVFLIYNPILDVDIPIVLTDTSLATSGIYKRTWNTSLGSQNHIVAKDGLTNPDSSLVSASAIHPDGGTTEAVAKALLIHGPTFVTQLPLTFQYLLVTKEGNIISNIL